MQPATAQLESTKWYENGISALCGGWAGGGDNEDTGASRVENMLRVLAARHCSLELSKWDVDVHQMFVCKNLIREAILNFNDFSGSFPSCLLVKVMQNSCQILRIGSILM